MSAPALSGSSASGYVKAMPNLLARRIIAAPLRWWFRLIGHRFGPGERASAPGQPLVHMAMCFRCGPVWMSEDATQPQGVRVDSNEPCPAVRLHNWKRAMS